MRARPTPWPFGGTRVPASWRPRTRWLRRWGSSPRPRLPSGSGASLRPSLGRAGLGSTPPPPAPRPGLAVTAVSLFGTTFQNPVLLASGTAAFGREVCGVIDLDALGGVVTKAVTPEPRQGNPPPRVAEFAGGMLNSVGLANPGLAAARTRELPWLAANLRRARVLVNVAGGSVDDYVSVIEGLTDLAVISAFEINASCPNTDAGGLEFGATPDGLRGLVRRCRRASTRPIVVKLSPVAPDLAALARVAEDEGADSVTLVNTIPGILDGRLGAGAGGVSGPALLP